MLKKYSYKSIVSSILIVGTILMPMSFLPKKAEAQLGVSGYTRGLAPAIAKLPQCGSTALGAIKGLFSGVVDLFSGETGGSDEENNAAMTDYINNASMDYEINKASESLDSTASSLTIKAGSSPSNAETNKLLKQVVDENKKLNKTSEEINNQSSCIASIGRLIAKMLLQKLTQSTVNWINSGYDGSPSFLQNPGKFFKDIADTQILQFGIEINGISPFSKEWLRNQALAYRAKFADNARYSLEEMIAQTTPECKGTDGVVTGCDEAFSQDFSVGGWDAWTAMTQVPANNPLGAKLLFDNEIQKRLADTSQSVAKDTRDALQAANGFLGDQRCVSAQTGRIDYNVTRSEDRAALDAGKPALCSTWIYVTPGKMVADAATTVLGYQNNSLLNVEDLNDAVAAISDAILNQFSSSIYEKGFANLDYQGIDGVLVFKNSNADYRTQTQKDYIPSQLSSSWLQANPDFDIRKDLTQALIDEQRTYSDKLALQNKELMSTIDGKEYSPGVCPSEPGWTGIYPDCIGPINLNFSIVGNPNTTNKVCPVGFTGTYPVCKGTSTYNGGASNAYGLMPAIYQLDYCIPGPHPGWENDSRETLNNISIPQKEISPDQTTQIANGVVGVGLNFVPYVGPVLSSLFSVFSGKEEAKTLSANIRNYYTSRFNALTGYQPQAPRDAYDSNDPENVNMTTSEGVSFSLNGVLDRYINIMKKTYFSNPDMLPTIAKEAEKEFNQLPGYNQIIKDNKNKMLEIKTTVSILGEIKDAVDKLNADYPNGGEDYENALKAQINAFGRLSASMVNGDDIAKADDLAKQIVLKKDYIYKNLLKGPYGCEADLEKPQKNFPSAGIIANGTKGVSTNNWADKDWDKFNVNSVKRMTYPFPILYDYNNFASGTILPDPWNGISGSKLPKMPAENKYSEYGPGFLSFVYFSAVYDDSGKYNGSERLDLHGLVNDKCPGYQSCDLGYEWVSVGKSSIKPGGTWRGDGFFEKTIGIY